MNLYFNQIATKLLIFLVVGKFDGFKPYWLYPFILGQGNMIKLIVLAFLHIEQMQG